MARRVARLHLAPGFRNRAALPSTAIREISILKELQHSAILQQRILQCLERAR